MLRHAQADETAGAHGGSWGWFLAGTLTGAVIGMLYAPCSGRSARHAITSAGRDWYGRSRDYYERGRELVGDAAELFERGRRLATRDLEP
jgi:gas vesicle protein